jgi:hypothetical protein
MPTWAVFVVVVVLVVGYYLFASRKQRRRDSVTGDFLKIADFHANQVYIDVRGEAAIAIDDRGRRIAVARRHGQPRTRVYSFAHIVLAELVQNDAPIGKVSRGGQAEAAPAADDLFGSTRPAIVGLPPLKPAPVPVTMVAVRVTLEGASEPGPLVRFYQGKAIAAESVAGEKAFGEARTLLGALDIAIKRAGLPPRPAVIRTSPRP